jgi:hypothetical protein
MGELKPKTTQSADLDFVLAVDLVVVQCILCDGSAPLVHVFNEGNILLGRNNTNIQQVVISRKKDV